jgi:uncharacterized protein (DUF1330 family)
MKTKVAIGLALLIGGGIGAVTVHAIHAQAKPPAYVIAEIDVVNQDGYAKEYLPAGSKAVLAGGAKYLARGTRTATIKGEPPKRIVLFSFENFDGASNLCFSCLYGSRSHWGKIRKVPNLCGRRCAGPVGEFLRL